MKNTLRSTLLFLLIFVFVLAASNNAYAQIDWSDLPVISGKSDESAESSSESSEESSIPESSVDSSSSSEEPGPELPPDEEEPVEPVLTPLQGYTTNSIYVRPAKGSQESLGILASGLFVSGLEDGAWLQFTYNGQTAYIAKSILGEKPANIKGYTTTSLFVRPAPGSSQNLGILPAYTYVEGAPEGAWLRVNYGGVNAYIAKAFVDPSITQIPTLEGFTTSSLYVRPSIGSSGSLGILPKFSAVKGKVLGAWLEISYQGQKGYIAKALVDDAPILDGYLSATIVVRNAPGGSVIDTIYEGEYVIGRIEGAWLAVDFNGQQGYLAKAFVSENPTIGRYFTNSALYIRTSPGGSTDGTIPKDAFIIGKPEGAWVSFTINGTTRYVARQYLREANPYTTGLTDVGDKLYYFKNPGNPATGFQKVDGSWYYFDPDLKYALKGLYRIDGDLYYFRYSSRPAMVYNEYVTVDGTRYYFNGYGIGAKAAVSYDGFSYDGATLRIYNRSGSVRKSRWVGPDHVYISLDHQYMWIYRNGQFSLGVPIISGKPSTPTVRGNFYVDGKFRNVSLKGPTWNSPVSYWVPFWQGAYGIHDANWQYDSSFYKNSNSYQYVGSHGCVNVRPSDMPAVYSRLYTGMPVTVD